jgi:hypothetical protein
MILRLPGRSAVLALALWLAWLALDSAALARESFGYLPPEREPRGERTRYVAENSDLVLQEIWAFLEEQGLGIETVDPEQRLIVVRYSGDPRPYLDCGKVQLLVDDKPARPPRVYSANKPQVRTARTIKGKRYGLLRQLRLDARLVIRIEPRGKGSRVFSQAFFVTTQELHRLRRGGVPDELVRREVVSFRSHEAGRFPKGTTCISNGKLEDLPLQRFRKES